MWQWGVNVNPSAGHRTELSPYPSKLVVEKSPFQIATKRSNVHCTYGKLLLVWHTNSDWPHFTDSSENKLSPQVVGLGPPMCSQIFRPVNFDANQLNILVHLPLL